MKSHSLEALVVKGVMAASQKHIRFVDVCFQARVEEESFKRIFQGTQSGDIRLAEEDKIVCKHEVREVQRFAVWVESEVRKTTCLLHHPRKIFHS